MRKRRIKGRTWYIADNGVMLSTKKGAVQYEATCRLDAKFAELSCVKLGAQVYYMLKRKSERATFLRKHPDPKERIYKAGLPCLVSTELIECDGTYANEYTHYGIVNVRDLERTIALLKK